MELCLHLTVRFHGGMLSYVQSKIHFYFTFMFLPKLVGLHSLR
jgi:hypothetical protein